MRKCLRRFLQVHDTGHVRSGGSALFRAMGRVKDFRPLAAPFRFSSGLPQLSRLSTHPAPAGRGNEG